MPFTYVCYTDEKLCVHVRSISLEEWMRLHLDLNHQVAGWTTQASITLLGHAKVHTGVDALRNVDRLLDLLISDTLAAARGTRIAYDSALAITVATHLLNHERSLANGLESCTATSAARALTSARLSLGSLAGSADVCARERHCLLRALHGVHEVNLDRNDNVAAACLGACLRRASRAAARLLLSEKLLELFKYVAEWTLSGAASTKCLVLEAFEAREATEAATESAERVLSRLLLLVARHTRAVIHSFLVLVSERLISFVDLSKLFLGSLALVHIWMVLFGFLEVRLLDVTL